MKFLAWLFNVNSRHLGDAIRYEKGKVGTRIWVIILLLVFSGASLWVEHWALNLLKESLLEKSLWGILALILLFFPLVATTIEYCGFYSSLGFRMFFIGSLESIIVKAEQKRKKKLENNVIEIDENGQVIAEDKAKDTVKNHKWLDLLVAIIGIVLGVGTLIMAIAMPSLLL